MKCSNCFIECRYAGTGKGPINDIGIYTTIYECPKCKDVFWAILPDSTLKCKNYSKYK